MWLLTRLSKVNPLTFTKSFFFSFLSNSKIASRFMTIQKNKNYLYNFFGRHFLNWLLRNYLILFKKWLFKEWLSKSLLPVPSTSFSFLVPPPKQKFEGRQVSPTKHILNFAFIYRLPFYFTYLIFLPRSLFLKVFSSV